MGEGIFIEVKGLDVVLRNIDALQSDLPEYLGMAGKESADEILNTTGLRKYPPAGPGNAPPVPYYIRGRGWQRAGGNDGSSEKYGTRWTVNYRELTTIIANNTSYAHKLGGLDQQPKFAAIGWRKLADVANEKIGEITKIFDGWINKLIRDKHLS